MKRLTAFCIALILFIAPVFTMPVFAEPEPRSTFDYTDDILEDGSLIYYFEELSLQMPAEWRGKLTVVKHDSGVSFYQKASNEKFREQDIWTGGFLFQLGASVNQSFTYLPSFRYLGFSEKSAMNYYLRLPTDYPAYDEPEIRAEYDRMFSQIDYVVKNARFYSADAQPASSDPGSDTNSGNDVSAAGSTGAGTETPAGGTTGEDSKTESTGWKPSQVRYFFEHKMLPRYFYEKPEELIRGVLNVGVYPLWESVAKENDTDPFYPAEDYIAHSYKTDDGTQIIQIEMPEPDEEPLCYRIYLVYNPDKDIAAYYTAECSSFVPDICFICNWSREGEHELCGTRDVLDKKAKGYADDLLEEVKLVALQEYVTGELKPEEVPVQDADQTSEQPADQNDQQPAEKTPEQSSPEGTGSSTPASGLKGAAFGQTDTGSGQEDAASGQKETGSGQEDTASGQEDTGIAADSGLAAIECKEQGFSFMADPSYSWDYKDGTGITLYTENEGSIPYVIVYQGEDLIVEAFEYINEQYTPHMKQNYGSDLVDYTEYEEYEIGGRKLPAGLYTYRLQGYLIDMLRIYDSTGKRTVAYTAKYIQGKGEETLKALDNAVRSFKAE